MIDIDLFLQCSVREHRQFPFKNCLQLHFFAPFTITWALSYSGNIST